MNLDCKNELVDYTKCLIKYQKSRFMCKIPKIEMMQCFQKQIKQVNLITNNLEWIIYYFQNYYIINEFLTET